MKRGAINFFFPGLSRALHSAVFHVFAGGAVAVCRTESLSSVDARHLAQRAPVDAEQVYLQLIKQVLKVFKNIEHARFELPCKM